MSVMLEDRDEGNTGVLFSCLLTQIILQSGINITGEPKMKIQQSISKQTLMKSNAWLRRDDSDDEVPIPVAMLVGFLDMASSSQTVLPSKSEINFSQIMEALAAIQGGMSTMQQSITSIQQEVHSINKRVEQNQLDLKECLKYHHPGSSDDEEDAPMAADDWVYLVVICFW
jgi:peptidoglycan hydrolase CwlO-like protein